MPGKMGRTTEQRMAILRNQASNLLWYGKIETTKARAKELRSYVEKIITDAINTYDDVIETKTDQTRQRDEGQKDHGKRSGDHRSEGRPEETRAAPQDHGANCTICRRSRALTRASPRTKRERKRSRIRSWKNSSTRSLPNMRSATTKKNCAGRLYPAIMTLGQNCRGDAGRSRHIELV